MLERPDKPCDAPAVEVPRSSWETKNSLHEWKKQATFPEKTTLGTVRLKNGLALRRIVSSPY